MGIYGEKAHPREGSRAASSDLSGRHRNQPVIAATASDHAA
jgi:hypothetical protein